MPKNKIQFQKGFSLPAFLEKYGKEEQCRHTFFQWRWSEGFECPLCSCKEHCILKTRELFQFNRCHHQASLTIDTIMASTKLPFTIWFLAMYLMTQTKNGISALELSRELGVSYNASWRLKHKLMQVMIEERLAQGKKVAILLVDMQPGFLDGLGPVSRYRDIMLDEGHTLDAMAGKEGIILIDVNMPDSDPTIGMLLSKAKKQ